MSAEYRDLHAMIFQNADARQYYNELPKQVRDLLNRNACNLNTYENLRDYVENLNKNEV